MTIDELISSFHEMEDWEERCDYLIDLGPEGGDGGGEIVATGTPEEVAADTSSITGRYLRPLLARHALPVTAA